MGVYFSKGKTLLLVFNCPLNLIFEKNQRENTKVPGILIGPRLPATHPGYESYTVAFGGDGGDLKVVR